MAKTRVAGGSRISTVVPGRSRGDESEDRALTNVDLAMKLHYIRGVYFFRATTDDDHDHNHDDRGGDNHLPSLVTRIAAIKKPMFSLLDRFFVTAGRLRRGSGEGEGEGEGRPYIKCNDAGVRIVEAVSETTVDEWLKAMHEGEAEDSCHGGLCYDQVIGPDLGFSPLVYLQFTKFTCGGFSVGLSWAHLLGDVLSATTFINTWAQIMADHVPNEPCHVPSCEKRHNEFTRLVPKKPMSLKEIEPTGNHWLLTVNNGQEMRTHSFQVTFEQLDCAISDASTETVSDFSPFEMISAVIWKSLSRIKGNPGPEIVTICSYDLRAKEHEIPNNKGIVLGTVEAYALISNVSELALQIARKMTLENDVIDNVTVPDGATSDHFVYGANLTFVNLEEVEIYGLKLEGMRPVFANYTISGVGEEGLVLVLPSAPELGGKNAANGLTITVVLPEDQLAPLKKELKEHWNISSN